MAASYYRIVALPNWFQASWKYIDGVMPNASTLMITSKVKIVWAKMLK